LAFLFRLFLLLQAPKEALLSFGLGADGSDYVNEAKNILAGQGFSRETSAPFIPDAIRTPLYPLALAGAFALFGSFQALLWIQIIFSSMIPAIVMRLSRRTIHRKGLIMALGLFFAFEPHLAFFTTFYASEGLAIFLLYMGIASLVEWSYTQKTSTLGWSGVFMGLTTLVRPVTFYIHFLLIPIMYMRRRIEGKGEWKKPLLIFTLLFFIVVSPWLVRNYVHFGSASMGTVGWFNMYTRVAVTTVAIDTGADFYTTYQKLLDELSVRGFISHPPPVSEREIQDPRFGGVLKSESLRIFKEHPKAFATYLLTAPISILTQDNTLGFIEIFSGKKIARPPFSPTLYISQHGLIEGVRALLPHMSGLYLIPYLARVFWMALFLLSLLGVYVLWQSGHRFAALFFISFLGYVVLFSLNAGAQIDARYRLQSLMGEAILAMAGLEYILDGLKKRYG